MDSDAAASGATTLTTPPAPAALAKPQPPSAGAGADDDLTTLTRPPAPAASEADSPATPPDPSEHLTIEAAGLGPADARARGGGQGGKPPAAGRSAAPFQSGTPFGRRYHLIRLLGAGGMGAVYQAWDDELAVVVAIKVIRPEAMADPAAARDLERRFKRELLLARNVTHKNVVRIHDLGEIDGVKYITMPYINGSDLATVLRREGRLPVPRALSIARQVAAGLVAAHEAGVVHRDLKPANILLDEEDRALITDFGIARSVSGPGGGTMIGTVVGTLEYMSPEQARAQAVDHRADIYAFGLMLADMLVGRRESARAESAVAELLERMTRPAPRLRSRDPAIPQALDDLVARCADPDPARRYLRTEDLLADLEALGSAHAAGATRPATGLAPPAPHSTPRTLALPAVLRAPGRTWLAAGLLVLITIAGTLLYRSGVSTTPAAEATAAPAAAESVSLAILPFRNASGDSSFDWLGPSLADMVGTAVGQSSALSIVPAGRVSQVLGDLRISPHSAHDPAALDRLAELTGAGTVLWGQYVKFGAEIRIDATLQDVKHQRTMAVQVQAANDDDLLGSIERLAASVRENLVLLGAAGKLSTASLKPSTSSVLALRYYNEGLELSRQGRHLEAVRALESSIQEDGRFALAHSKLAQSHAALGYGGEAERLSRSAVTHAAALPPHEKSLILAGRARVLNDQPKAIELYEEVDRVLPRNDEVQFALATLYEDAGAYDRSREAFARLLARDPTYLDALLGAARIELRTGRPNEALEHLTTALTHTIKSENDEGRAAVLWALGVTYRLLNKPDEALRHHEQSLEIERRIGRKRGIADNLHGIAQLHDDGGRADLALESYSEALALRREIGDRRGVGDVLLELGTLHWAGGQYERALLRLKEALQVQREVRNQPYEALALNNIGAIYLSTGEYEDARTHLERALALRERIDSPSEIADTLHNLGEIALKMGEYDGALDRYLKALELRRRIADKRGVALEQHSLGVLFEYQGRFAAAVDSRSEARKLFAEIGDGGVWTAKSLAGQGSALSQIGRFDDAQQVLEDALARARAIGNHDVIAQVLNLQGATLYYQGDAAAARRLFEQAAQMATRFKLPEVALRSRLNLALLAIRERRPPPAAALQALQAEAEHLALKYESVQALLLAGEADLGRKQHQEARRRLEDAMEQADRLGSLTLGAQAHHLLARAAREAGDEPEARRHAEAARRLLRQIQEQAPNSRVLQRSDLKPIADESSS